jgi:hypothetical protein
VIAKAEALVHRLDAKIDALCVSFVALVQDGSFQRKMLYRVSRCLEAVEAQTEDNKRQTDQLADEMGKAEGKERADDHSDEEDEADDDWAGTLEALNLAYALSKDTDDVLADCKKIREVLYLDDCGLKANDRPTFKKFRALGHEDGESRAFVATLVQAWSHPSPNLGAWEHALEPEPAESTIDFVDRVLADAEQGDCDVMEEAHETYSAALEKALLQNDAGAWDEVWSLDRKIEWLTSRLDLSAGLSKVMEVVSARHERQRAHLAALASGHESDPPEKSDRRRLERAWIELVFSESQEAGLLGGQLKQTLEQILELTCETTNMTLVEARVFDLGLAPRTHRKVAGHLARAASVVAESSPGIVVQALTEDLKLAHALLPEAPDEEEVDADLELALVAFVGKAVQVRKDNLRSELVFAAYTLQMAMQKMEGLDESESLSTESLSSWMEAELKVAGGDRAAAETARAAKQKVDNEIAASKRQAEHLATAQRQALLESLQGMLGKVDALRSKIKNKTEASESQTQAEESAQ